jgi:asparagine synthase (glutamine-hydrolysing)
MLYLDWKQTLADNDLRKVNRMCALAGVEVCYPLLDDDIVELSTRVPPALKVKGQQLRYFFKWALRDFLPPSVLTKTKHGFGLPFGLWMRSHAPLRELAYDSLGALKRRHYVNPAYIDRLIELHGSDHASYYGEFVWVLMMLEQWLSRHADASAVRWTDAHAHPAEPSRRP